MAKHPKPIKAAEESKKGGSGKGWARGGRKRETPSPCLILRKKKSWTRKRT